MADGGQRTKLKPAISKERQWAGIAVACLVPVLLTALLAPIRDSLGLDTVLLLFVLVSVVASVVGGVRSALVASLVSFGLANFYFAPPYGSLLVASGAELIDLVIFFAVAVLVGLVTEIGGQARGRSERGRLRAEWLAEVGGRDRGPGSVEAALSEAMALYGMNQAKLIVDGAERVNSGRAAEDDVLLVIPAGDEIELHLSGPERVGEDRAQLSALALTTGQLWRTMELSRQASRAEELARIDELRASLLGAVGHDLRNPLATITVAAATLREPGISLTEADRLELLDSIQEHAARLNAIIGNLLDASRLRAGVLSVQPGPTNLFDVLPGVLGVDRANLELDIPDDLPLVQADPGLLDRVLANLVDNAIRQPAGGQPVLIRAGEVSGRIEISVVDHGPGLAPERFEEVFAPFQHFGDRVTTGVGLGLAIARGFTQAMGGILTPSVTPGGGLTMTVRLEVAEDGALAGR